MAEFFWPMAISIHIIRLYIQQSQSIVSYYFTLLNLEISKICCIFAKNIIVYATDNKFRSEEIELNADNNVHKH